MPPLQCTVREYGSQLLFLLHIESTRGQSFFNSPSEIPSDEWNYYDNEWKRTEIGGIIIDCWSLDKGTVMLYSLCKYYTANVNS